MLTWPFRDSAKIARILLIGDESVGKSSLLLRFTNKIWKPDGCQPTIGFAFESRTVCQDEQKVHLQIWDTAGSYLPQLMALGTLSDWKQSFYGVILVFDVSDRRSFERISFWVEDIVADITSPSGDVPLIIVANKTDLPGRVVSTEEGQMQAHRVGASGYCETSARDGTNCDTVFHDLALGRWTKYVDAPVETEYGRVFMMDMDHDSP